MPYKNYFLNEDTLIVYGNFFGISTGLLGGWKIVKAVFNHTVSDEFYKMPAVKYLRLVAKNYGLKSYFGLLTAVPMRNLSIGSAEDVTAFITAGVDNPNENTINMILVLEAKVSKAGMLNAIITATEAKSKALFKLGYSFTGTNTDAVVILSTMKGKYERFAGPASDLGKKIWKVVFEGVMESLKKK
ncbi:MAG: adenosylcobinamide amidohydrolase [Archaeoglobaceae archaeon]|nr:adenosylcobinamide amidohydrolase [Archaeoglobales archaeon]